MVTVRLNRASGSYHSGSHEFIGQVETDTDELYNNKGEFPLINLKKKEKKKKYRDSGTYIHIELFSLAEQDAQVYSR